MPDTDYVLVIHGTWNAPDDDSANWYQLDDSDGSNFCTQLNHALEQEGMGRPVWRSPGEGPLHFSWSGENRHSERLRAGETLDQLLREIIAQDPSARIHIVAHSHGANVALYGLQLYLKSLRERAGNIIDTAKPMIATAGFDKALNDAVNADRTQQVANAELSAAPLQVMQAHFEGKAEQPTANSVDDYKPAFTRNWMQSRDTNRVGRLVFMGAPFYWKFWRQRGKWYEPAALAGRAVDLFGATAGAAFFTVFFIWVYWLLAWAVTGILSTIIGWIGIPVQWIFDLVLPSEFAIPSAKWDPRSWPWWLIGLSLLMIFGAHAEGRAGKRIGEFLGEILGGLIFIYGTVIGLWWLFSLFSFDGLGSSSISFPSLNILAWPLWLQIVTAIPVLILAIIFFLALRGRRDVNLYFDTDGIDIDSDAKPEVPSALPYPTLVAHADVLDEALLGLSAEPLVFGLLAPQIRAMITPTLNLKLGRTPSGLGASLSYWVSKVFGKVPHALHVGFAKLARPIFGAYEKYLTTQLLHLIASPALGIAAHEFGGGIIVAQNKINLPGYFNEHDLDISQEVLAAPPRPVRESELVKNRYAFLLDKSARDTRSRQSALWQQVDTHHRDIKRRYRRFPQIDTEKVIERMQTTSLVLEERLREVIGAVGLVHSAYHSNGNLIRGIAYFLSLGPPAPQPPEDAADAEAGAPQAYSAAADEAGGPSGNG